MFGLIGALGAAFAAGLAVFFYIIFFGILYLCCPWWIWLPATIYMGILIFFKAIDDGYIRPSPVTEIKQSTPEIKNDPTQMGKKENYVSFSGKKNSPSSSSNGMNIDKGNGGAF